MYLQFLITTRVQNLRLSNVYRSETLELDHLPMIHISQQRTLLSLGSKLQ